MSHRNEILDNYENNNININGNEITRVFDEYGFIESH